MTHPSTKMLNDETRRGGVVHNDDFYRVILILNIFSLIVYYVVTCKREDTCNTFSSQKYRLFYMNCISHHAHMEGQSDFFPHFVCP